MISKIFNALKTSRSTIGNAIRNLTNKNLSDEELDRIEEQLLQTDMGYDIVQNILDAAKRKTDEDSNTLIRRILFKKLPEDDNTKTMKTPAVMMIVGVNGSGKTTSTAKLAHLYKQQGFNITLIAADTYRAAAIDQLRIWSEQIGCKLVYNEQTSEPSSVIYDGLVSARSRKSDLVIIDTAGRLHNSAGLMGELGKMHRVVRDRFSDFDLLSLITIDANMGQNSLNQAKEFQKIYSLEGAILTKLDGTAHGGIIFPLYDSLNIPVRFVGTGEKISDIQPFQREVYLDGLLEQ